MATNRIANLLVALCGRSGWSAFAALVALVAAEQALAQQVVIQRNVTVRETPVRASDPVDYPEIGTALDLLDEGNRRSGYYHVRLPDGREGWVYQTFVRRVEGAPLAPPPPIGDQMAVHYIDVDQGAAALLEFPCGAILVDAGGRGPAASDHLVGYLNDFFARRSDLNRRLAAVFVTHTHIDHNSSLKRVAQTFGVGGYIHSGIMTGSGRHGASWMVNHAAAASPRIPTVALMNVGATGSTSQTVDPLSCSGTDPKIQVLSGGLTANPGWPRGEFDDENNHSLVIRVDYGEASFLFTGDLETHGVERLLHNVASPGLLDVDVYAVGHHGSHNGTTAELLAVMTPDIAVISMGPSTVHEQWSAWDHGHPRRTIVTLLDSAIARRRTGQKTVKVADGQERFTDYVMRDAVYATGWDGDTVISARPDGTLAVRTTR